MSENDYTMIKMRQQLQKKFAMLNRRAVVQGMIVLGATSGLSGCQSGATPGAMLGSAEAPIGIQLYTLGDLPQKDLERTLGAVARIGYKSVELPGFIGKSPADLRRALDAADLKCTSVHVGLTGGTPESPDLTGDPDKVAERVQAVGAGYVVVPMFAPPPEGKMELRAGEDLAAVIKRVSNSMTAEQWKGLASRLNSSGQVLKGHGLKLGYHNHNIEFAPRGATTGWDILVSETDPDLVVFELDAGWASAAGLDPADVLHRSPGRFRLMHVKDLKETTPHNVLMNMEPTEVGYGRINWNRVLTAARDAGVREYFVEQEPPFERDRLDAARMSFDYLTRTARQLAST
jgi:sugar phosphate isomerase/epimerase